MNILSAAQIERWRALFGEYRDDHSQLKDFEEWSAKRLIMREEMLHLLHSYLAGQVSAEEFKTTFDRKTRKEWAVFGLKGPSGAMFLNMLVKNIPDQRALANHLPEALKVPRDAQDGQEKMQVFLYYLEGLITAGFVSKLRLQPDRVSFFLSAWWHLQQSGIWPIPYLSARTSLEGEGLYKSSPDIVLDYFAFRDSFLSLALALDLKIWELEHLCIWVAKHTTKTIVASEPTSASAAATYLPSSQVSQPLTNTVSLTTLEHLVLDEKEEEENVISNHAHIQWLLARVGSKLGCHIWIATNDQGKVWNGKRLGDLSLKSLPPLGMDASSQRFISLIDVLWIKKNKVAAAFEVEHTTSIYSGLLRMSDLVALSPNLTFPLYIVTPQERIEKVQAELSRPTFQSLQLHERCGFFSEEELIKEADAIMRWAKDTSAIDALATKVGEVNFY